MKTQYYFASTHALAFTLAFGIAISSSLAKPTLRDLCTHGRLPVTRISDVQALLQELNTDKTHGLCSDWVRAALIELDQLINNPDISDVCSLAEVEKITEYYKKYMGPTLAEYQSQQEKTEFPINLKEFVLAYGLKVSALCKKNMINSLELESKSLLKPEDFEALNRWTDESSALSQIIDEPGDYDDLLLPSDLKRFSKDSQRGAKENEALAANGNQITDPIADSQDDKLFLQTATGHIIERVQAVCERRFKPIYEQLILPLIYLSNVGINYQGEDLEREMQEMSVNKGVHQWYRIVYLCESLIGIEIVEDPRDRNRTEGMDKRLVRILSKEEANKLKVLEKPHARDSFHSEIEPIHFKPETSNKLEDLIFDLHDLNLKKLVISFASDKSEMDRIRIRLVKKLARFLLKKISRGEFRFIGSLSGSGGMDGSSAQPGDANVVMVKMFNDYVREATARDGAVAGKVGHLIGGVGKRYYYDLSYNGASGLAQQLKKSTIDKACVGRYFYYAIAVALFILGISLMG